MDDAVMELKLKDQAAKRAVLEFEDINYAAEFEANQIDYRIQQEKYESAIREMRAYLIAEAEKYAANIELRGFRRPIIQQQIVVVADKGPAYRAARQAVMRKLFIDPRTRTMDSRTLRERYLREAEREANYLGELPASIWNRPFRDWEQVVANRGLIANGVVETRRDGEPCEKFNTLAKVHNRIAERANADSQRTSKGATGKNFGALGRIEFLPGKRIAWLGRKPSAYRGEGSSIRLTIKDATTRQDIRIFKTLTATPFNVKPATVERWIANAEAQAASAEYSPIEAQRDEAERFTGSREL